MKRILVAGIGNIFFGDDAFGCEVAAQLQKRPRPRGVRVIDFGIRSYDLAYALMDCDAAILIDAISRGEKPGTLLVIEPDVLEMGPGAEGVDAHRMNPFAVLQMVRSFGGQPPQLSLVGCEPHSLEPESGELGLSPCVREVVTEAVALVESLLAGLLDSSIAAPLETVNT